MLPLRQQSSLIACAACCWRSPLRAAASAAPRADTPTAGALYTNGPSGRYLLDGTWYRRSDPRDRGIRAGYQRARRRPAGSPVTVPDAANAADKSARSYLGGVCWYRKDFEPPARRGHATGCCASSRSTTARPCGSTAAGWAATPAATCRSSWRPRACARGTNRLVVRVDSRRTEQAIPPLGVRDGGKYVGGWWNYAGILREVYLRRVDTFDFVNVAARPRLDCPDMRRARLRARGRREHGAACRPAPRCPRRSAASRSGFTPATIGARGFRLFRGSAAIASPRLWSPDDPHLYTVELGVSLDGEVVQRYTQQTGIRSIERRRRRAGCC